MIPPDGGLVMTAQIHEVLFIDGAQMPMAFCPPLPTMHPRILADDPETVARRSPETRILFSTACWRGYRGTWKIEDDRLFLVKLEGRYRLDGSEPLVADWFTGVLRVPRGDQLSYVHMGFGTVFEMEIHIKIENGVVAASRTIDNRGKRHDPHELAMRSLPGHENRFPGDDEL
jgi:hypothetical protein